MLKQFRVQNYKALRDVCLDLTPIHVLIGPNDSGKTSILEAVAALSRSTEKSLNHAFAGAWDGRSLVWEMDPDAFVTLDATFEDGLQYQLACRFGPVGHEAYIQDERVLLKDGVTDLTLRDVSRSFICRTALGERLDDKLSPVGKRVFDNLRGLHFCRWNTRLLSLPAAPDSRRRFRMDESGFGLALCLDDILGYDRVLFTRLEDRFREIFPHIRSVKLIAERAYRLNENASHVPSLQDADGKGIYFQLKGSDKLVAAAQASDGVMLVLAYLTLLYLPEPPRLVLVEEPENGIHPKRLEDVLKILRTILGEQGQSQVILTTHSPYVVDLFSPGEVTLCKKDTSGAVLTHRLSSSPAVLDQLDVFSLGEIWTAEGDEAIAQASDKQELAP